MSEHQEPDEVGFWDQADAAKAEQGELVERNWKRGLEAGYYTRPPTKASGDEVPDWMHEGLLAAFKPWMEGVGRTCMHNPSFWKPQPVYAAAWRPGLVVCAECMHLFGASGAEDDRTCDRCGRVCGGLENGDPIHSVQTQHDFMLWLTGLCDDCAPESLRGEA